MTDIIITMNGKGEFTVPSDVGRIEEYRAKRLKIKLDASFLMPDITYYTISFEPFSLSRKIITENIYRDVDDDEMFFYGGYLYCPIYDYIAVSPKVMVQVDAYETDDGGNVTAIIKSGILTLEFAPSLTGEGVVLETVRPDVKFTEKVNNAVAEAMKTQVLDGANLKDFSVTSRKLGIKSVGVAQLADLSVSAAKIWANAVTEEKIDNGAVTSEKLASACVTEDKIGTGAVTSDKISDKNVTSAKLADSAVTNAKLAVYSVSENKIRPLSVSTTKIVNKAVTPAKLDRTYLTEHQSLADYATQKWVEEQNYLTEHLSLDGYATEQWVNEQNFITDSSDFLKESDLPERLSELENDIAVSFMKQTLTDEEKATALENIGAVKAETGKGLSQNDFTDEDKAKLDSALTSHQDISMKADISSLSSVAFSGSYNDLADRPDECLFNEGLKENYDASYNHSILPHAPENAEENIVDGALINGKTAEIKEKKIILSVLDYVEKETVFAEVY